MRRTLAALLLLVPAVCWAEPFVLDLPPGVHNLSITVAADGTVSARPLRTVVPGGGPTQPNPPVDPPPVSTPLSIKVEQLTNRALVEGGTKTSGAAIASVYSLASKEVAEGRLAPDRAFDFTSSATATVLGTQGAVQAAKWDNFRRDLAAELTPLNDAGQLTTKEQVASVMKQIATGMDKATGFNSSPASLSAIVAATPAERAKMGLFDGIDIAQIIELVKLILTLLSLFKGGV